MKKFIGGAVLAGALIGSVAVAPPASANATRIANCTAIGGVYETGNNPSNDRCTVRTATTGAAVATGDPTTSTIINDLGEAYLSTLPVRVERGETVSSNATTYGDWAITSYSTNTACVYAGKSKVQKCTATTYATESRDVFTITTLSTPLYDIYEVIQDRQSVTTGTQATTVTTITRTMRYRFNSSDAIANLQSEAATESYAAGDAIAIYEEGDVIQVKVGEESVATGFDVDVLEPLKTGEEVAEPYVVSSVNCIINGSKQTVRDNSCPV